MEEELQRSLLSAIGRMTETLGRAEGSARKGDLHEAMVFLAALERDAGGSAKALGRSTTSRRRAGRWERPTGTESRAARDNLPETCESCRHEVQTLQWVIVNKLKNWATRVRNRFGRKPMFSANAPSRRVATYDYSGEKRPPHGVSTPRTTCLRIARIGSLGGRPVGGAASVVLRICPVR